VIFNSLTFLVFFLVVLTLHRLPLSWSTKKHNLLIASYLFYAAWSPPFVVLIWISTLVDWFAAKRMPQARSRAERRGLLVLSLSANLGLLGFFKYGNFLLENFVVLMASLGIEYHPPQMDIVLPVAISFYTFQTLSYTLDVYRGKGQPWHSFLDFALFVGFFPQLVAGPIVRAFTFLPQCVEPRRATREQLGWGLTLLAIGLMEKTVLADALMAPVADRVYGAAPEAAFLDAWLGTLAFSAQIFLDFSGYSLCAIGAASCLGFVLPQNFRFPYAAIGFSDFWRRWHISLSSWLRDYLYISLGGNRKGSARTHGNLMLTMLLGGLWHGASWQFVVWGGLHGIYLIAERFARRIWGESRWVSTAPARIALALFTYFLVCITWVFFRAQSFSDAWTLLSTMFVVGPNLLVLGLSNARIIVTVTVTVTMLVSQWLMRERRLHDVWLRLPAWTQSAVLACLLISLTMTSGANRAFIYFQF